MLRWFVRGVPAAMIAHETGLERKRVLRALTIVRLALAILVPANLRRATAAEVSAHLVQAIHPLLRPTRRATLRRLRFPVIGLYAGHGRVWAELLSDAEGEEIGRVLRAQEKLNASHRPVLHRYTGISYRGRLYRIRGSHAARALAPFGQLEGFWGYLHRQLRAKGGIRRQRLGLYLAEYAWRYNRRRFGPAAQLRELLTLLRQMSMRWSQWDSHRRMRSAGSRGIS